MRTSLAILLFALVALCTARPCRNGNCNKPKHKSDYIGSYSTKPGGIDGCPVEAAKLPYFDGTATQLNITDFFGGSSFREHFECSKDPINYVAGVVLNDDITSGKPRPQGTRHLYNFLKDQAAYGRKPVEHFKLTFIFSSAGGMQLVNNTAQRGLLYTTQHWPWSPDPAAYGNTHKTVKYSFPDYLKYVCTTPGIQCRFCTNTWKAFYGRPTNSIPFTELVGGFDSNDPNGIYEFFSWVDSGFAAVPQFQAKGAHLVFPAL